MALPAHPTMRNCRSFRCVLLSNQIYLTRMCRSTISLRLIWSICSESRKWSCIN